MTVGIDELDPEKQRLVKSELNGSSELHAQNFENNISLGSVLLLFVLLFSF